MLCLYVFGGEVLHGFSFALVVGILIGTYSSIAVAAPMLVAYQDWRASTRQAGGAAGSEGRSAVRLPAADAGIFRVPSDLSRMSSSAASRIPVL